MPGGRERAGTLARSVTGDSAGELPAHLPRIDYLTIGTRIGFKRALARGLAGRYDLLVLQMVVTTESVGFQAFSRHCIFRGELGSVSLWTRAKESRERLCCLS